MSRVLKKIAAYRARLGTLALVKLLFLIILSRVFGRQFLGLSAKFPIQKMVLPGLKQPVYVRPASTDIEVMQQVLLDNEYEFSLPSPPKVIVDAGANIGLASVYFANKYPDATIIALEPDPSNFKLVEMNTAAYPQIRRMNVALWNENKQLNLFSAKGGHCGFRTLEGKADELELCGETRAVTIDKVMEIHGLKFIDILKIDIEGAELEVFQHSSTWIDRVGALMAEVHDSYKPGCSDAFYAATKSFRPDVVIKGETILRLRDAKTVPA